MRLDTECDVTVDVSEPDNAEFGPGITAFRDGLLAEHLGVDTEGVAAEIARTGSLIATIDGLRGSGRTLRPFQMRDVGEIGKWLADNEVLDPEGPGEMFESITKRSLFRALRPGAPQRRS